MVSIYKWLFLLLNGTIFLRTVLQIHISGIHISLLMGCGVKKNKKAEKYTKLERWQSKNKHFQKDHDYLYDNTSADVIKSYLFSSL